MHSDWYYKLIYLDILSAKYPMSIPEIVKTTTKVGPAKTWYFMPWPFSRLWRSKSKLEYRKVTSTSSSRLEAHAVFFRFSMKGKFDVYLL